ncbi:MAG: hypothetical protein JWO56_85 [Acidobacteria bacterium]|nr:hypothetical protein [Acidobacteriota bacterium]
MKRILGAVIISITAAALPASAQRVALELPSSLASKARESVDVTLDGPLLRLAAKFLSNEDAEERQVRAMVNKLEGIYVRSYEFDDEHAYDVATIEKFRAQLGPEWKRLVTVKSRDAENVEIYAMMRGEAVAGLVVIAAEPRELTLVNIVGPIDLEQLASLEGEFGIPRMTSKSRSRSKEKK